MDALPTPELIRRAQAGDMQAMHQLLARHQAQILVFIRLSLGRTLRAKEGSGDILAEVMLAIWQNIQQFKDEGEGAFIRWVRRIMENEIRDKADYWQAKKRRGEEIMLGAGGSNSGSPELQLRTLDPTPTEELLRRQHWEHIEQALEMLSEDDREVIIQRDLEGLSFSKIGETMDCTEDTARMRRQRAWKKLLIILRSRVADV